MKGLTAYSTDYLVKLCTLFWMVWSALSQLESDKNDIYDAVKSMKRRQANELNNGKVVLDDEAKAEIFRQNLMGSNQLDGANRNVRQQPIFPASISAGGSPQNPALFSRTTFQPGQQPGNNRPSIAIAPSPVRPEIITLPLQALTRESGQPAGPPPIVVESSPPPPPPPASSPKPAPSAITVAVTAPPARPSPQPQTPPRRVVVTAAPAARTPQTLIFTRPPVPPKQTQPPPPSIATSSPAQPHTRIVTKQPPPAAAAAGGSAEQRVSSVANFRPNFVSPSGKTLLNPHVENFCDLRQYPDEALAEKHLQRVEYFVANLSCSRQFFECAVGQTYLMNCTSAEQVFDISTVICNFKSSVKACPEFDNISHCTIKEQCQHDQFACCALPQTCISYTKRCDGVQDCSDGEDENNCPSCEADEFPCVKSGKCISWSQHCNGVTDECFDQTNLDEHNCQICGPEKFYCSRSEVPSSQQPICLDLSLRCNGLKECPKGEDELNCKTKGPKILLCEDQKQSVNKEQWCDGTEDCIDGSDEQYCAFK